MKLWIAAIALCAYAQTEFEVASIKLTDPKVSHVNGVRIYPGGRVVITAVPLKTLITAAFRLSYWQIQGGEPWMEKDNYDIEAKPPENLRGSIRTLRYTNYGIEDAQLREMLQTLLIQRFQLKFHRDTKPGDVYLLERSTKPLALQTTETPAGDPDHFGSIGFAAGHWVIADATMAQLAKFAADNVVHTPVLDRTGLDGAFNYDQPTHLSDSEANYRDPSDSFLNLIPELGLKLQRTKGQVEIFVIDHAVAAPPN